MSTRTASRWRPYPAYKDSGVGWLGEIPSHWRIPALKHVCLQWALYGANEPASTYADDGIRFLRTSDIDDAGNLTDDGAVFLQPELVHDYLLRDGDLLLSRSGTIGRSFVYDEKRHGQCAYAGYLVRFVPDPTDLESRFAFYFTKSTNFTDWLSISVIQSTIGNVNGQKYANLRLGLPPLPEQRAIAAFLDRETAHIDALIAAKQRLIALLQEKRSALINHAVSKGLDPSAPMRDSGIPWLGEIPVHWEVKRLKQLISYITSGSRGWAEYYSDDGPLFIRVGNLSGRPSIDLDLSDVQRVLPPQGSEGSRTRVERDDVLIAITGATIGAVAVVENDIGEAYVNQHVALTRPIKSRCGPKWLGFSVYSSFGQSQVELLLTGGTKQGLGLEDVNNFVVVVPPVEEQQAVIACLEYENTRIDTLTDNIRGAITHLHEYRAALISAAVTGKIDVRGEV